MFSPPVHPQHPVCLKPSLAISHPGEEPSVVPVTSDEPTPPNAAQGSPQAWPFPPTSPALRLAIPRMNLRLQQHQTVCCPSIHHALLQIPASLMLFPLPGISPSSLFLSMPNSYLPFETPPGVSLWFSACPATVGWCPPFCCHYDTLCISPIFLWQEEGSFCPLAAWLLPHLLPHSRWTDGWS